MEYQNLKVDAETCSRLFFAARNLAVELFKLRFEGLCREAGFNVELKPSFDSRYSTLKLLHKYKTKSDPNIVDQRIVWLVRDVRHPFNDVGSPCTFSLKSIQTAEYYRYRKPDIAERFDQFLKQDHIAEVIRTGVLTFNWPMPYISHICV